MFYLFKNQEDNLSECTLKFTFRAVYTLALILWLQNYNLRNKDLNIKLAKK